VNKPLGLGPYVAYTANVAHHEQNVEDNQKIFRALVSSPLDHFGGFCSVRMLESRREMFRLHTYECDKTRLSLSAYCMCVLWATHSRLQASASLTAGVRIT